MTLADGPDRDDGLAERGEVEKEIQQVQTLPRDPASTLCRPALSRLSVRVPVSVLASAHGDMDPKIIWK